MNLSSDDYYYYLNLLKGFEGERRFDEFTEKLKEFCLILNDLQLEIRRSSFQIDTLLIFFDKIVLYEIKNYEGVHYWGKDKFTKLNGVAMENPALQLQKTRVRLELLLSELGCQMKVEAFVVYINPEFTLLGAPADEQLLLPSQISGYFGSLRVGTPPTEKQKKLANELVKLHKPDYPSKMPEYRYEQLKKGIPCTVCGALLESFGGHRQSCVNCGKKVNVKNAIKTSISEFRILYPNEPVTSIRLADWCGAGRRDRIFRILRTEFTAVGSGKKRHYV
ncbi:nuclease-related domain-containing protein [Trichococcus collinsii]|nr:nuclease-related domain-containing protein [Trichococcus collinsii]